MSPPITGHHQPAVVCFKLPPLTGQLQYHLARGFIAPSNERSILGVVHVRRYYQISATRPPRNHQPGLLTTTRTSEGDTGLYVTRLPQYNHASPCESKLRSRSNTLVMGSGLFPEVIWPFPDASCLSSSHGDPPLVCNREITTMYV